MNKECRLVGNYIVGGRKNYHIYNDDDNTF